MGKLLAKQLQKVQHKFAHNYKLPSDVPKGSFVVYVDVDEMRRFVVNTNILYHDLFQELLARSAAKYGHPNGSLIMDCKVPFFKHLVQIIETGIPVLKPPIPT